MRTSKPQQFSTAASNEAQTAVSHRNGIDIHIEHLPNDEVFYLTDRGIKSERVIRAKVVVRSLISTAYQPDNKITYVMESGIERDGSEVFATREALIASL